MEKKLKILVVEDEIFIADYIQELIEEFYSVEQANTVAEAIAKLASFGPDVVIMDINLEKNAEGVKLANSEFKSKKIIFLTAQNDSKTIQNAIDTNPENYLTKPVKRIDLLNAIKLVEFKIKKNTITIKDGTKDILIQNDDLLYIKSDGNYIDVFTSNSKHAVRQKLDAFYELLDHSIFIKVHRSFIVNKNKITSQKRNAVFINKIEIPTSRNVGLDL